MNPHAEHMLQPDGIPADSTVVAREHKACSLPQAQGVLLRVFYLRGLRRATEAARLPTTCCSPTPFSFLRFDHYLPQAQGVLLHVFYLRGLRRATKASTPPDNLLQPDAIPILLVPEIAEGLLLGFTPYSG